MKYLLVFFGLSLVLPLLIGQSALPQRVLIYTKNGRGYIHDNIATSVKALQEICAAENILTEVSDNPEVFTSQNLKQYTGIIFSNSNNEAFDTDDQRSAFQQFMRQGGGFMGVHSASGSERNWPWYWALLGGKFVRHSPFQSFDVVTIDSSHSSLKGIPRRWTVEDECYYTNELNPDLNILLAADLRTVEDNQKTEYPGEIFGHYFPLSWCHQFEGGRAWYTALGHDKSMYQDPAFRRHLRGGILWILNQIK